MAVLKRPETTTVWLPLILRLVMGASSATIQSKDSVYNMRSQPWQLLIFHRELAKV